MKVKVKDMELHITEDDGTVRSYSLYLTDDDKVHHAVNYSDAWYNVKTLYPYEAVRDGWRNVCGDYTIKQVIYRIKKGTLAFF